MVPSVGCALEWYHSVSICVAFKRAMRLKTGPLSMLYHGFHSHQRSPHLCLSRHDVQWFSITRLWTFVQTSDLRAVVCSKCRDHPSSCGSILRGGTRSDGSVRWGECRKKNFTSIADRATEAGAGGTALHPNIPPLGPTGPTVLTHDGEPAQTKDQEVG